MESITLGQILSVITFLGAFIGGIGILLRHIKKWLKEAFKDEFKDIKKDINNLKEKIDNMEKEHMKKLNSLELDSIRNDLVNYMSLAEEGFITPKTKIDMYALYDNYCKMGGNSYVHDKWETLKRDGKL